MTSRWAVGAAAALAIFAWLATESAAAGLACLGYGLATAQALARRHSRAARALARAESLELLASAAADLRAGATAPVLILPDRDLDRLARAAQRISDRTGAPLADLLDRLERQQSTLSRLDAAAHAQSAGLRASAALLLALPLVGLALGHLIGANPTGILLHTTIGQLCAALAIALQLAGLAWTDRLARTGTLLGRLPGRGRASFGSALQRLLDRTRFSARSRRRRVLRGATSKTRGISLTGGATPRAAGGRRSGGSVFARVIPRAAPKTVSQAGSPAVAQREQAVAYGEPAVVYGEQAVAYGELAVAADLIAASLRAGAPVSTAVLAAGETLAGPLSPTLNRIGTELRLGVPPHEAWRSLDAIGPARRVVAAARRSAESGAALSGALTRCADDLRADAEHARQARAQRAGVLLVLPLGLCFLPAFVLAGLVPVVLAVLREVL